MRSGMGNLLETDSDVASISDGEKERTDGDGMEMGSDALLDVNKNANMSVRNDCTQHAEEYDKTADCKLDGISVETNENLSHSSSQSSLSTVQPSTSSGATSSVSSMNKVSSKRQIGVTEKCLPGGGNAPVVVGKSMTVSPRELPPRSQLIQLKPTMHKPKIISRNSMDSLSEGINKQKNPRFIPYEPYRGAVRPMEGTTKRHSRTASEASAISTLEKVIGNLNLTDSSLDDAGASSLSEDFNENTQDKSPEGRPTPVNVRTVVDAQYSKQGKVIEKQIHALTLLKERLKISEKDNDDLHRENTRLKKLLVDSLCGDSLLHGRTDTDGTRTSSSVTSESVDTLSNEIEVWRSKFLSSCVLVEQLTRENGVLNDAVGSAASILKDIKLSSSLSPANYEQVNTWLRANRSTPSPVSNEYNNTSKS